MDLLPTIEEIEKRLAEPQLGYKTLKWSNLLLGRCPYCDKFLTKRRRQMICESTKNFKQDCYFSMSMKSFDKFLLKRKIDF